MFTGIITAVGHVSGVETKGEDKRLAIDAGKLDLGDVSGGDSICVSGVCLTVTALLDGILYTDISTETLSCTTLGDLAAGDRVNLEKAMRIGDRLGGHLVSGHIDGVGKIRELCEDARSVRYIIEPPAELNRYICRKGSICVDGVSLTVNDTGETSFSVNIIPYTMDETIFSDYRQGSRVNLEVDIIARYLERLNSVPH